MALRTPEDSEFAASSIFSDSTRFDSSVSSCNHSNAVDDSKSSGLRQRQFQLAEMAERCHCRRHRSPLTSGTQISVTKSVVYDLLGLA